jgi:hypothetical protein
VPSSITCTVTGKDFKLLIEAVTRFPSIGTSGLISLKASDNKITASNTGIVISKATKECNGELPIIGIDEKMLIPLAGVVGDASKVIVTVQEKEISIRSKTREITAPNTAGKDVVLPKLSATGLDITDDIASKIRYLSNVAMQDSARPEVNCVMLAGPSVIAINQKAIAYLVCNNTSKENIAIPLAIAKAIKSGDTLYAQPQDTFVKSGIGWYAMPSPVKAQQSFPVATIEYLDKSETAPFAVLKGHVLASALLECSSILSALSKVDVVLTMEISNSKLQMSAMSGTAKFRRVVATLKVGDDSSKLNLPLEQAKDIGPLIEEEESITVGIGKKHNEVFFKFSNGWAMFPSWHGK